MIKIEILEGLAKYNEGDWVTVVDYYDDYLKENGQAHSKENSKEFDRIIDWLELKGYLKSNWLDPHRHSPLWEVQVTFKGQIAIKREEILK